MLEKANSNSPRTDSEKQTMIEEGAKHYGLFLEAMNFNWKSDPQTIDTPNRVAKAWVNDIIKGSINKHPDITIFPNEENYKGLVMQVAIPVFSMCAHHNLPFVGYASIGYVPWDKLMGLSKFNRVVDWFARRPQMQESLTQQIHDFLAQKLECKSVAVSLACKHMCCGGRGIKHPTSVMVTNSFSGVFMESNNLVREEFMHAIMKNGVEL